MADNRSDAERADYYEQEMNSSMIDCKVCLAYLAVMGRAAASGSPQ